MPRFDRYMLGQLIMLFGLFALVFVAVYWVNRAVTLLDQIISDGQSALVFLELTALTLPNVIRIVLPVPAFIAAVYVTNRLMSEGELVVMQAAGQSPFRLARPALVFGAIVACMMLTLSHWLVPFSRAELSERRSEIAGNVTARFLVEGRFMHPADGITVYVREITERGELNGLFLSDNRNPQARTSYTASRALLVRADSGPKLLMFEGLAQTLIGSSERLNVTRFRDLTFDLGALIRPGALGRVDEAELPTTVLLAAAPETVTLTQKPRSVLLYEAHERFAQPLFGMIGPLLGFAAVIAGGFSRFGPWRQVVLAVGILVAMKLLENAVADYALSDESMLALVYLPSLLGLCLSLALLAWAARRRSPRRRAGEVPA